MSRCEVCGSRECCGGDISPGVAELRAIVAELVALLRKAKDGVLICRLEAPHIWSDLENRIDDALKKYKEIV